ncbi:maleylpyruvate isomerase N-terminal domain-containing protein [Nakamurella endophytica]|nr:maleylpyruvate isomerase N-terminal domain-containing protein [Nakamurella endophytica]
MSTPPDRWASVRAGFAAAATWFVTTAGDAAGQPDRPALGVWTVRDLVGHTGRALLTVENYLQDSTAGAVDMASPAAYYRRAQAALADPVAVAERGRAAGAALGEDLAGSVAAIASRVLARVAAAGPDDAVDSPVGRLRLVDYLPTRTFELTVHTCDLAVAIGVAPAVPDAAAAASLALAADLAVDRQVSGPLLLALTGRTALPEGFSLLEG